LTLLVGRQEGHPACKKMGGWWRWALVSPDGVAPSWVVGVSASVTLPLHQKVQKFSSGTGSPGWSRKKGCKTVVVWRGIRPQCSTTHMRPIVTDRVAWSVCRNREPCKNGWTGGNAIRVVDSSWSKKPCMIGRGNYEAGRGSPLYSTGTTVHVRQWRSLLSNHFDHLLSLNCRVGNFYPRAVLTMVKTRVKTGLGKTPKTHISWSKLGKTNFLNLRMLVVSLFCGWTCKNCLMTRINQVITCCDEQI